MSLKLEMIAGSIGSLLGSVLKIDFTQGGNCYSYLHVRIDMDIRGSMPRETTLVCGEEDKKIEFRYERLFLLCFWCGLLDHIVDDCVDFLEKEGRYEDCKYDENLRGIPPRQGTSLPRQNLW